MVGLAERPFRQAARRLVAIAAVATGLGLSVWFDVLPRLEAPPVREGRPLLSRELPLNPKIALRWREKDFSLEKSPAGWELVEAGARSPILASRGEDFLRGLREARILSRIGGPEGDLAEFGLAPARGFIRIESVPPVEIFLGMSNPPLTGTYVQVFPGGEVDLVGAALRVEVETLAAMVAGSASKQSPEVNS